MEKYLLAVIMCYIYMLCQLIYRATILVCNCPQFFDVLGHQEVGSIPGMLPPSPAVGVIPTSSPQVSFVIEV